MSRRGVLLLSLACSGAGAELTISYNKALDTIGREVFWKIPNDYATMVESRNNGVPLIMQAPKAKLTRSYVEMAEKISLLAATTTAQRQRYDIELNSQIENMHTGNGGVINEQNADDRRDGRLPSVAVAAPARAFTLAVDGGVRKAPPRCGHWWSVVRPGAVVSGGGNHPTTH